MNKIFLNSALIFLCCNPVFADDFNSQIFKPKMGFINISEVIARNSTTLDEIAKILHNSLNDPNLIILTDGVIYSGQSTDLTQSFISNDIKNQINEMPINDKILIGYVNIAKILEKIPQSESAKKQLEQEFSPVDKKLVSQQKEIQVMEDNLRREILSLSESERNGLEQDIENKKRDFKRDQEEFKNNFEIRRQEELSKIKHLVVTTLRSIATTYNYDILLSDGVIYAGTLTDATNIVLQSIADENKSP